MGTYAYTNTDTNISRLSYGGNFGGGNVGKFGESSVIRQTKTIKISTYN